MAEQTIKVSADKAAAIEKIAQMSAESLQIVSKAIDKKGLEALEKKLHSIQVFL